MLWNHLIPTCNATTLEILKFIVCYIASGNVAAASEASPFSLSISSAYRWLKHFRTQTGRYRSILYKSGIPPPEDNDTSLTSEDITLKMFSEVSKPADGDHGKIDHFANFQLQTQSAIL